MVTLREKLEVNVTLRTWLQIGSSQTTEVIRRVSFDQGGRYGSDQMRKTLCLSGKP
jgi:hypothetical protein